MRFSTYSTHAEVAEDTSTFTAHYTPILDLRIPGVAMHLRELELCLGAHTLRKRSIADDMTKSLPIRSQSQPLHMPKAFARTRPDSPLRLICGEHLALGVVANIADVDIAPDVKLLRAEHRHDGGGREELVSGNATSYPLVAASPGGAKFRWMRRSAKTLTLRILAAVRSSGAAEHLHIRHPPASEVRLLLLVIVSLHGIRSSASLAYRIPPRNTERLARV